MLQLPPPRCWLLYRAPLRRPLSKNRPAACWAPFLVPSAKKNKKKERKRATPPSCSFFSILAFYFSFGGFSLCCMNPGPDSRHAARHRQHHVWTRSRQLARPPGVPRSLGGRRSQLPPPGALMQRRGPVSSSAWNVAHTPPPSSHLPPFSQKRHPDAANQSDVEAFLKKKKKNKLK